MGIASIKYFLRQCFSVRGFLDSSQQTSASDIGFHPQDLSSF